MDEGGLRDELRRWIDAAWDPDIALVEWRVRLVEAGWACPSWPAGWGGRGLPAASAELVADELAMAGVPGPALGVGSQLAGPTILEHGSDSLKERLLRPTLTGETTWCQLFSEPGAGSDLAGLTTRAVRDGSGSGGWADDEWVVSGQKVWNTGAAQADLALLVARTDRSVPKHRGLTCFVLPMRQPGVEVRPLRQMNGHASFNEVFLDKVRVPAHNVIGEIGQGWQVALTTLAHERRLAHGSRRGTPRDPDGRIWQEANAELEMVSEPHKWYPQRAGRVDLLSERASVRGRNDDPVVRQEISSTLSLGRTARWTAERAAAARALGRPPGAEGSIGKLASSVIARRAAHAHAHIAGAAGMLSSSDDRTDSVVAEVIVSVPAISIAGGTDEIQHNIRAERILGLPREPNPARDLPFIDIPHNPVPRR